MAAISQMKGMGYMAIIISILISFIACANDGFQFTTIFTYLSIATLLLESYERCKIHMIKLLKSKDTKE